MTESDPGGGLRDTSFEQLTRSARRMSYSRRAAYAVLEPVLRSLVRLSWAACRRPRVLGEQGARLVQRLGGQAIRGSSTYAGASALRDFYEALVRRGVSPAITPDGPRGPAIVFKPGAILLAQSSGRPMLPKRIDALALDGEQVEMVRRLREVFEQSKAELRAEPA